MRQGLLPLLYKYECMEIHVGKTLDPAAGGINHGEAASVITKI